MTEKEFKNLKVGDEVWRFAHDHHDGYYNYYKVEKSKVAEVDKSYGLIKFSARDSALPCHCFLTKLEADEALARIYEGRVYE